MTGEKPAPTVKKNATLTSLQINTDTFANISDPDEMAHTRIYTVCHSVVSFWLKTLFAIMNVSKLEDGRVHFRNSSVRVKIHAKLYESATSYSTCPKILNKSIFYLLMFLKTAEWVANNVDSDQMLYLIWVYTVCSGQSAWILRVITIISKLVASSVL